MFSLWWIIDFHLLLNFLLNLNFFSWILYCIMVCCRSMSSASVGVKLCTNKVIVSIFIMEWVSEWLSDWLIDCRLTPTQINSAISMREQVNFLWFSVKCFVNHCLSFLFFCFVLFCYVLFCLTFSNSIVCPSTYSF